MLRVGLQSPRGPGQGLWCPCLADSHCPQSCSGGDACWGWSRRSWRRRPPAGKERDGHRLWPRRDGHRLQPRRDGAARDRHWLGSDQALLPAPESLAPTQALVAGDSKCPPATQPQLG